MATLSLFHIPNAVGIGGNMPNPEIDNKSDKEYLDDLKGRFGDLNQGAPKERWGGIKDRFAIVALILVLAFLVFMMVDGSITNFRCTIAEFITLECNRWAGEEHPSLRR
jgi:hypothetical protein